MKICGNEKFQICVVTLGHVIRIFPYFELTPQPLPLFYE